MRRMQERMPTRQALDLLGLPETCTLEDVKSAYRQKAKDTHPDKGGCTEEFIQVKAAYDTLMELGPRILHGQLHPPQTQQKAHGWHPFRVYSDPVYCNTTTPASASTHDDSVLGDILRTYVRAGMRARAGSSIFVGRPVWTA